VLDFYRKQQSETNDRPDAAHEMMGHSAPAFT
jgi:hypothetical protein